jgi:lipopolysaccharide/colanic/teichoic acid biosynthesis glycosyltransferase
VTLLCLAAYGSGLPDLRRDTRSALLSGLAATAVAATSISVVQLLLGSLLLPRFVVFASALVLVPWYALCTALASDGRDRDEGRDRVLAVVGVDDAAALEAELHGSPERPALLVAVLDPAAARPTEGRRPVLDEARASGANVVVLDRFSAADDSIVEQAAELHESGSVRIRTLTLFYDEWLAKLPVSELERVSLMFDIGELHRARYGRVKRMMDIAAAAAGLVALGVALPFVMLGNVVANRGALFFRQERVGRGGRRLTVLKLRTMRPGADTGEWTVHHDPRITRFGSWLRRTHVDELPQAWNLLRGDLSLVGPRPEQPRYVDQLKDKVPFYDLRHLVRPGLTGWAQVKYDYGSSEADALEKLQYEFWYLRHQAMTLDARIVGRTMRTVIGRSGR